MKACKEAIHQSDLQSAITRENLFASLLAADVKDLGRRSTAFNDLFNRDDLNLGNHMAAIVLAKPLIGLRVNSSGIVKATSPLFS